MREKFAGELKAAMKAGEKRRVDTIRMIMAALKEKDIEARGQGKAVSDEDILALLQKMVKGRNDLAAQESEEITIIESFLPSQMSEVEVEQAIAAAITETDAASIKDMGRVVGALKGKYAGRMDFAKASALVKTRLSAAERN